MATIVIDAGHGGSDWGATRDNRMEKADALGLAIAVGRELSRRGNNVIYTRQSDVFISPIQRAQFANDAGANFLLSVHRDAFTNPTANGSSVLVRPNVSASTHACAVQMASSIANAGGFHNRGVVVPPSPVPSVLASTNMPSLLIEVGFISNIQDNARYDNNFSSIVNAIADGVVACLGSGGGVAPPSGGNLQGRVDTAGGALNVRSSPNTGASIVTSLPNGAVFAILSEQNGWFRIRTAQGLEGWVSRNFVSVTPTVGTVTTSGGALNMRSAPSTAASVIRTIPNGSRINITGISGSFFNTNFGGSNGWVSRDFIRL